MVKDRSELRYNIVSLQRASASARACSVRMYVGAALPPLTSVRMYTYMNIVTH